MKLPVYIATDRDWAFLSSVISRGQWYGGPKGFMPTTG